MPKVEMDVETSVAPDRVLDALLDFSERRTEIWPGITPGLYEVYEVGETHAEIKEGTKMPGGAFWARERYDWSTPGLVTWTVQESNFCAPGSYVSAAISPREDGGTRIHITWNRTPTTIGARMAAFAITATKGKPVAASFAKAMKRLERVGVA
jgi:hypothetical protein